ncbi:Putative high-affinity iron permease [Citrobacter freundii]|uniref:High-affinity iron permease n=1 Tax=Citrobacter freundii TaxID=546 RepID=A0A7G2IGY9_CITFR|nr:Putative high-affinity iron permease [Citrobacter freundii]
MAQKKSLSDVQSKIDWLKASLREVEPVLDGGHRLVAEEQHNAFSRTDIAVHWQESFRVIDDLLAQAVNNYQAGNLSVASQKTFNKRTIRVLKTQRWKCRSDRIDRQKTLLRLTSNFLR